MHIENSAGPQNVSLRSTVVRWRRRGSRRTVHALPDALEKHLPQPPAVLGVLLLAQVELQFLLDLVRAAAALDNVVEDVAIRVGRGQRLNGDGKVAPKPSLAGTMLAL